MHVTYFVALFPEQGQAETRTVTVRGDPRLPDDEYALVEVYCTDPTCHCRRVMLNVFGRRQGGPLATIGFGFDRGKPPHEWWNYPEPMLDPLNPQGPHAPALLDLVLGIIADRS